MEEKELKLALENHGKEIEKKNDELKKAVEAKFDSQVKELKAEIEKMEGEKKEMQKQLDEQNIAIQKAAIKGKSDEEFVSLEKGIRNLLDSPEFKAAKAAGFPKNNNTFQVKADTSNITGTINMTQQNLTIKFAPERTLAFLPSLNGGVVGADKNRVMWVEGTYTSAVGYVNEGTTEQSDDAGTAVEKTRAMAKVRAKLPLTAEMLEDAEYIASAFRMKMQEKALLFVDGECYDGAGSDAQYPNKIYGIKGHATAFNAASVGDNKVEKANIGDLLDAVILQAELAEQKGLNTVWMNPKDFFAFKKTKDVNGQYLFVKDVNGNYTVNGLNIIRTSKVDANTLTAADTSKVQLWWKRNPEIKFSQMNGTDFIDDRYTAVMFLRNQLVIEGPDKTAVIHVADIAASLAAITASQA